MRTQNSKLQSKLPKQPSESREVLAFPRCEPRAETEAESPSSAYPYVVIRVMPTVYLRTPVCFTTSEPSSATFQKFTVHCRNPWIDSQLSPECETKLLDLAKSFSKENRFRCCAFFSPERANYVEPGGTSSHSSFLPRSSTSFEVREGSAQASDEHAPELAVDGDEESGGSKRLHRSESPHCTRGLPKGIKDYLGDELHLFETDDSAFVLSSYDPVIQDD